MLAEVLLNYGFRTAIDRLQQTAKSLQTAIRQLNDDLRNYHESLSELSNTASTNNRCIHIAYTLTDLHFL